MRIKSVVLSAVALTFCLVGGASAQTLKTDAEIEAMGYTHIYSLSIPDQPNFRLGAPYTLDNSNLNLGPIESVAYRLNLGENNFCYASFSAYTNELSQYGVPTFTSGAVAQRYVQNLYYEAKSPSLNTTGTTVSQGNIEFWPYNYGGGNAKSIPNANAVNSGNRSYDFGDTCNYDNNYGSMQVHDYQNRTTVFAFNRWNNGLEACLGIGNCPDTSVGLDWTHKYTTASYDTKQLDVFAKPVFSSMSESDYSAISGEVSNMQLVYKLDCPLTGTYSASNYVVNNAASYTGMPLSRVGYYMVMEKSDGTVDYAYTGFDPITNDVNQIGLPFSGSSWYHQQTVSNMTVQSNVEGVVNGSGIATGNVEIWNTNYSEGNALNIPNASGDSGHPGFDFGDTRKTDGNYACFQIHNYGASQTVMALNRWNGGAANGKTIDMGIGNNPVAGEAIDYTFDGDAGANSNASQYQSRSLYVMAEVAIAPGMSNVPDASKYAIVQGARLTSQMNTGWSKENGGVNYDIVNNVTELQKTLGPFDRVGYYMEYAQNANDPLKYVFVSFDTMTADISKIGVPTNPSGEFYQKVVKNLNVTTNVTASDGLITDPGTGQQVAANKTISYNNGYLEFWASNYGKAKSNVISQGDANSYDINDSGGSTGYGHGSMQIHSLDTEQTIFALNHFNGGKQFGIGKNATGSGDPDWTNHNDKQSYAIANIYTFAKPVLFDMDETHFQPIQSEVSNMSLVYKLECPLNGTYSADTYTVNNASNLPDSFKGMPIGRVAYYMTLEKSDGSVDYAYASYDSVTNNPAKLGLPYDGSVFQTTVNNLTVSSNVNGVVNGTGLKGNIEFWNKNYNKGNANNIPGADGNTYDFGDQVATGGDYASFQIHNYGDKQTVIALNAWNGHATASNNRTIDIGIGTNPNASGEPDYTFDGERGVGVSNASQYANRTLYVMASPAIAPGMANVTNGSDYTMVQGARLTTQMGTNWHDNGVNYDIVNNLATLQNQGVLFDRVGYYMEYAATVNDPLTYVFVSFDAMTTDISKIGIPISSTGEYYQQFVNNLEVTTNVAASQGRINDPNTGAQAAANKTISHEKGFIEFCASNYSQPKGGVNSLGSNDIYDINDTIPADPYAAGHGSMQIHSIDTQQTIFALNHLNGTKQYGIGTNPNPSANSSGSQFDWTFDENKKNYAIANIYTFVHEVDALLTTTALSMYQRDLTNQANVTLSGTWAATNGVTIDTVQASVDGGDWFALTMNSDGTFTGTTSLIGGMHDVSYQAVDVNGNVVATKSGQVGVGEIFITAGQSNSTNCGDVAQASTSSLALAYNPKTGQWQQNADPQQGPLDGTQKGSTWPSFADTLSAEEGVPVATYSVGYSGTNLSQWLNDEKGGILTNMENAIEFLNENANGFAGILWHQGESGTGDNTRTYYDMLTELIGISRTAAGDEDLPWGVAIASANANGVVNTNVTNDQRQIIADDPMVFLGVDTDEFFIIDSEHASDPDYQTLRGTNGNSIHLSDKGLKEAGRLWALTAGESIVGLRKYWRADSDEAIAVSDWEVNGGYKLGIKLDSGEQLSVETNNNVQMLADGTVEVGEGYSLTLTGDVTGSGEMVKTGKGDLTLSGDRSGFTGKTTVTEGKLTLTGEAVNVNGPMELTDDTTIVYNVDEDNTKQLEFSGDVTLSGGNVLKTGNGKLKILAGEGKFATNNFTVEAGELDFKGELTGDLIVKTGSTLSPGNSVGDLTVYGNVIIETEATGLFEFKAYKSDPESQEFDTLTVEDDNNSLTLDTGSIIQLYFENGDQNRWAKEGAEYQLVYGNVIGDADTDWNSFLGNYQNLFALEGRPEGLFLIGLGAPESTGVPEPSTWALLILGAAGLIYFRKRK